MPSLHDTQALVMGALLRGDASQDVSMLLRPSRGAGQARRLQVYRNNLHANLGSALAAVYPVVARLVGDAYFRQLARAYVVRHPSTSGNLHAFGDRLPAFLRSQGSLEGLPYLADVAALEWASHEVYHESDAIDFDMASLAQVPAESQVRIRLHLQLASRFVASPYPVLAIWKANQSEDDDEVAPVALDDGGVRLLVARAGFEVEFRVLDAAEDRWLRTLADGRTITVALQAALEVDPGFDMGATLGRHLALGSFRAWSLAAEEDGE